MQWLPPALAQSCNSANTVHGSATIPVLVDRGATTLADSGKAINNYAVRLGAFDQFAKICIPGEGAATLVFDLSGSGSSYVFEDIRYGFPAGFAPANSPFKLSVVGKHTVTVYFKVSGATSGHRFKYDLILRNVVTGERLILDPEVTNRPPA